MCGTGQEPTRPRLPLLSVPAEPWPQPQPAIAEPWADPRAVVWEPHLTSDREGRVKVPLPSPPSCRSLRLAVTAVTRDGRVAHLQTLLGPDHEGCR